MFCTDEEVSYRPLLFAMPEKFSARLPNCKRVRAGADCKNSTVKVIIKLAVRSSLPYGKLARGT